MIALIEIIMTLVTSFNGIKNVEGFMKGMLGMNDPNSVIKFNKKKNKEIGVNSTNRIFNNQKKEMKMFLKIILIEKIFLLKKI